MVIDLKDKAAVLRAEAARQQAETQLHTALTALARIEGVARSSRDVEMWQLRPLMDQIVEAARRAREWGA